ncbi:MAG: pyridoxal-dependent decarboxylase [Lachnospiraceae bacterium]|jgi:diaminopimelate decarboxylase|nr:pyridoxal-dependent decarboxylase [Lachnospiraceae bacterium]
MEALQTPYFIIDEAILQKYYHMLTDSLRQSWGNYLIGYSFKTNSLPWLISFVKKNGAYAEVVSEDEYLLARHLGYQNQEIIYNGPYKSEHSFREVLLASGCVNLDSQLELTWLSRLASEYPGQTFSVGIRANFDLEKMCPGETTMGEVSGRFGFCYESGRFAEALQMLRQIPNVSVIGLHLHSSSKSRSVKIFRSIAQMACKLQQEFDLSLSYVDLGGGYCGGMEGRPEYPDYFPVVAEELSRCFTPEKTKLIVEPGISLISKCTTFVTSVFDTRDIKGTRYVMTDGSRFNIDATMIKTSHLFHIIEKEQTSERPIMPQQIISGYTCMECDRMFTYENHPELVPGDQIIYENVGGYTMSLNPLFIQYFPAVYIRRNGSLIQVRRKWTPEDYVQGTTLIEDMKS